MEFAGETTNAIWLKEEAARARAQILDGTAPKYPRVCPVTGFHLRPGFFPSDDDKPIIMASNDESIIHAYACNKKAWTETAGSVTPLPKSEGAGIMVVLTVCVNFAGGVVGFTDDEYAEFLRLNPGSEFSKKMF